MTTLNIALFGASGMIGQRILDEAVSRNHKVTAITRNPDASAAKENVSFVKSDILDAKAVAEVVKDHDVVISAYGPGSEDAAKIIQAAHSVIAGLEQSNVKRLVVVGGAGSLEVAPGVTLVSLPEFPAEYKDVALAHKDALEVFRQNSSLDWTYLSPAAVIQPGERTGKFRLGKDSLVSDANGDSNISAEDYAIVLMDEVETPKHTRQRFTAAY